MVWGAVCRYAEANGLVLLYPQMTGAGSSAKYDALTSAQRGACWDSYGQTGDDYALQSGVQMATVRRMLISLGVGGPKHP
jgi:hypothetical protein